jgi:hypothetical protein
MIFAKDFTVPANTPEDEPEEWPIKVSSGVLSYVGFKFPAGCHGMVKVRLWHGEFQIVPLNKDEWITGDGEEVKFTEFYEVDEEPYEMKIRACSPDTTNDHTITLRMVVLPKMAASLIPFIDLLTKFFRRIGVIS